ncbi:MAG: site-specific integrase [Clostridia bacterium]|nr:site-specific integrase [Clostridia bacterium]
MFQTYTYICLLARTHRLWRRLPEAAYCLGVSSNFTPKFLNDLARRGYSLHTVRAYRAALGELNRALEDGGAAQVPAWNLAATLVAKDEAKNTVAVRQAGMKSFVGWLAAHRFLGPNPAAGP